MIPKLTRSASEGERFTDYRSRDGRWHYRHRLERSPSLARRVSLGTLVTWLVMALIAVTARAADDPRTLEVTANAHVQQGRWSEAETAFLELLAAVERQSKPTTESERQRLRCWNQLEQLARRTGRPDDALRFALMTREAISRSADDDLRNLNLLQIAEYQLALGEDIEARTTLSSLLADKSLLLKTLPKLRAQYLLGVVEHRTGNVAAARTNWQLSEQSITPLLNRHRKTPFLSPSDWLDLQQRLIAICEAQRRDAEAKALIDEFVGRFTPPNRQSEKASDEARNDSPRFQAWLSLARHARLRKDSAAIARHLRNALEHTQRVSAPEQATAIRWLATVLEDGDLPAAEQLLRQSLAAYEAADQVREQLRSLLQLATIRRSLGDLADAERLLRTAIELADQRLSVDDLDRPLAKRQLAALLPSAGRFREAIALNQQILDDAQQRGTSGDRLRADVLLNLAIIDRNQGLTESAADKAQQAARAIESVFGSDAWPLAAVHNVQSAIQRDLGQADDAARHARTVLRLCQQHGKNQNPEAATAFQQLGSLAARKSDFATATTHWKSAAEIFRSRGQTAREAHVLSLLGGVAFKSNDRDLAAAALDHAEQLLGQRSASPLDLYVVLANQAVRRAHDGDLAEAIRLLQQAVEIAESARTETAGDAEVGRARFFAQFAPAFERLIDWHLQSGQTAEAFLAAEQSRSRTFLDQLQLAGIDLKATLPPETQQRLLPQERSLAQRQQQLRNELASEKTSLRDSSAVPEESGAQRQRDLDQNERDYARIWQAIRDASPIYNQLLAGRDSLCDLARVQHELLSPDTVLLFYQIGSQNSSVWIIGGDPDTIEVIPLQISQALPALQFRDAETKPTRGIAGHLSVDKGLLRHGLDPIPPGPVTRDVASRLVTWYLAATVPFTPSHSRGLSGTVATVKGEAIQASSLTLVAETLLPPPIRAAIQRRQPKRLVIVPDAALHQLPFEALLLSAGARTNYVLDEWPPITYAPSATVLSHLARRAAPAMNTERRLLLVGYSPSESSGTSPLPGVATECRRIATAWPQPVTKLLDQEANTSHVTRQLPIHPIVHLATHGFVNEQTDNLFGGLLLAPDADGDDSLSYLDILRTDLTGCELAVLSACQTSVGPERPMEASTSLAQAFLAAGARQVVASLWHVSDDSTSELMTDFYKRLAEDAAKGRSLRVAESLHAAKRQLRQSADWNSPAHWASFVFVGPAK